MRQIVCPGMGREGLMVRALCMRLMHLGLDAHMAFDMTTPRVGAGDLLIVSSGPGQPGTLAALINRARGDGAQTLVVTAHPIARRFKQLICRSCFPLRPWPTIPVPRQECSP